jgi:hypothetical protein
MGVRSFINTISGIYLFSLQHDWKANISFKNLQKGCEFDVTASIMLFLDLDKTQI